MGWIAEGAYEHEGWVANVLADGRAASGSTRDGVVMYTPPTEADEAAGYVRADPGSNATHLVVPWDKVVTWRASCECGWVGPEMPAVTDPQHGDRDCPEDLADRVFYPAWTEHVAPFAALSELGELAEQLRTLEAEVDTKVRLARVAGASWSQIGFKVGLTKQGAQQRWGNTVEGAAQR